MPIGSTQRILTCIREHHINSPQVGHLQVPALNWSTSLAGGMAIIRLGVLLREVPAPNLKHGLMPGLMR
jgi:hypothetical protein